MSYRNARNKEAERDVEVTIRFVSVTFTETHSLTLDKQENLPFNREKPWEGPGSYGGRTSWYGGEFQL